MLVSPVRRRSVRLCALVLPFLLGSCCTMALWGYEEKATWNLRTKEYDCEYVAVNGTQWEWWRVMLRVVVTPVTLVLDGTGSALAFAIDCWVDDDEDDGARVGSGWSSRGRERAGDPNSPKPPPPPVVAPSFPKRAKPMLSGARR